MRNSCARRSSAGLSRPVMQPVLMPAVCASVKPCPSCASNVLISSALPSGCESSATPPSVIVPSTSISSSLIFAARFLRAGVIFGTRANGSSIKMHYEFSSNEQRDSSLRISGAQRQNGKLYKFQCPQVVKMDHAHNLLRLIYNHHRGDLLLFH